MAIRKKDEVKATAQLPAKLQSLATKAFGEQFLQKKFEDHFKATKSEIEEYLETNSDGFSIDTGKATACEEGTFNYIERTTITVDKDKLIEMVANKEISLAQILACVSTFKNEDLEKAITTSRFKEITTSKTSASLTLKANREYKAKMEAEFNEGGFKEEKVESKVLEIDDEEVIDVKKLKKKPAKKVSASVDDDLESILNS